MSLMDIRHKILITGDFGVGKSTLALAYSEHTQCDVLSLDYERGQDFYVVEGREQAKPGELFAVRRVVAPTLYEVKLLIERIRDPKKPAGKIVIDRKPLDPNAISDRVKAVSADIMNGKLNVGTILIDTVTRLCDQTAQRTFEAHTEKLGLEKAERMSQLIWGKAKDEVSELLFSIIESDMNLVMTAWAKAEYDANTRQRTGEVIADVLKNVNAFVDLTLLLEANPRPKGSPSVAPRATVQKSRLRHLPVGSVIAEAAWPNVFGYEPPLEEPAQVEAVAAS